MIQLLTGDCREVLRTLPDASVQCVVTSPPYYALRSYLDADHADKHREIGSEATPDAYIATMVEVFREVRRVLRPDGTCWVNMGDSYAAGHGGSTTAGNYIPKTGRETEANPKPRPELANAPAGWAERNATPKRVLPGIKPKDLLMMPARFALALQADGWWVRSDIIWAKPNPMPESVTDRPTNAHEHIFLLTRSARYFYDAEAVREPGEMKPQNRFTDGKGPKSEGYAAHRQPTGMTECVSRNLRNVWTIATHAFPAAHFATFPPELAERCIRAGTSERGCCAACGKPWVRQQLRTAADGRSVVVPASQRHAAVDGEPLMGDNRIDIGNRGSFNASRGVLQATDAGWRAGCQCNADTVPCTVLDPFSGAGTTALVADRLGRHAIGIDLSHAYVEMARERLTADCPLFADLSPAPPQDDAYDRDMADLFAPLAAD